MPKIVIPQLSAYAPGAGYGTDIIFPNVPQLAGLTRLNVYGSAYSVNDNSGPIEFINELSNPPAGIAIGSDGLVAQKNTTDTVALGNISEAQQGTMFMLFTLGYDGGPSNSDRANFITSNNRLSGSHRYRDRSGGAVEPFIRASGGFSLITSTTLNDAVSTPTGISDTAIKFGNICMSALVKDITNEKVTRYEFTDEGVYAKKETGVPGIEAAGSTIVNFGNGGGPGPITLHAIGYYDSQVLTDVEINELWLAMRDTVMSARS